MNKEQITAEVLAAFALPEGQLKELAPYGSGHINDTFRVTYETEKRQRRYILQRMNKNIFEKPVELMENIVHVTEWIKKKSEENGGDPERETLTVVCSRDGKPYYLDSEGQYWRIYLFVEGTTSYDQVEKPSDFYESAVSFGHFQRMLADFPAKSLHETIPDFHNTAKRFETFQKAVAADVCGRAASVKEEIQFVLDHEAFAHTLCDLEAAGKIPTRVTHNDTKLNNILIDNATGKGICVIDLDTVMPGLAVNDFGDSIRFGASTGAEDEPDLSKIWCDLDLYELYVKGFIEGCGGALTDIELDNLPTGAMMMTFECGMRFLTDYLEGDHYFKTTRDNQNLDRAHTQFKLVKDMEEKLPKMKEIVNKYR